MEEARVHHVFLRLHLCLVLDEVLKLCDVYRFVVEAEAPLHGVRHTDELHANVESFEHFQSVHLLGCFLIRQSFEFGLSYGHRMQIYFVLGEHT